MCFGPTLSFQVPGFFLMNSLFLCGLSVIHASTHFSLVSCTNHHPHMWVLEKVAHVPLAPSALCLPFGYWLYLLGLDSIKMPIFGTESLASSTEYRGPKVSCPKSKLYVSYAFVILLCIYKGFYFFSKNLDKTV